MNLYNIAESTKLILFQLIAFYFPILCLAHRLNQIKEIYLKQNMPFFLQCQKTNENTDPDLNLKFFGYNHNSFCLTNCEFQSRFFWCNYLANLTSNFKCQTDKHCEKNDQCTFVFNNANIGLDGYNLACTDKEINVIIWQIKGINYYL